MSRLSLRREDVRHGLRVAMADACGVRRLAMLTGKLDTAPPKLHVEVMPEGNSTGRLEFWPISLVERLPMQQQLVMHGGRFKPPVGWPMVSSPRSPRRR